MKNGNQDSRVTIQLSHPGRKTLLATVVGLALGAGGAGVASAAAITSILIQDVGSTTGCPTSQNSACATPSYSSMLDGAAALFRLNVINPGTATNAAYSEWTNNGSPMLWGGAANPTGSFSTGFLFSGAPFIPFTYGTNAVGDITGGVMTVSSLDFGGNLTGSGSYDTPPDPGTLFVNWVHQVDATHYDVSFQWSSLFSVTGAPYNPFDARWLIEGVATVASSPVPVPAAVWLLGSGLVGLAGVACRRKKAKPSLD